MRVPDGGSIFQLSAYKRVVDSLSDSYIFRFDVSFFKITHLYVSGQRLVGVGGFPTPRRPA